MMGRNPDFFGTKRNLALIKGLAKTSFFFNLRIKAGTELGNNGIQMGMRRLTSQADFINR